MNKTRLLFLIIFIEGYVVLATELLAIRLLVPYVGSGTETVAIIISAVLMPLAVGYHYGGRGYARAHAKAKRQHRHTQSIRKILLRNILIALSILTFGLAYPFLEIFFALMSEVGITHRLPQTAVYSALFLVTPVFLLGQTVPLISHYFSRRKLNEVTGRMLFFSTTGSFFGSVFSTLVLMMTIGVHHTVIATLTLLAALVPMLNRRMKREIVTAAALLCVAVWLNSGAMMREFNVVSNNAYNLVQIADVPREEAKIMIVNRSSSSKIAGDDKHMFAYWQFFDRHFVQPMLHSNPPRDVLIIGAGGFTFGLRDEHNHYTYVDIDPALKKISEEQFLPSPLTPNKRFAPASARAFVHSDTEKYDLILVDAYTNMQAIPMECTTREFLLDVKARLKDGGFVVANVLASPTFGDRFSVRYDNTFASVFPGYTRQVVGEFDPWSAKPQAKNLLYIYKHSQGVNDAGIYTDDRNTFSLDR